MKKSSQLSSSFALICKSTSTIPEKITLIASINLVFEYRKLDFWNQKIKLVFKFKRPSFLNLKKPEFLSFRDLAGIYTNSKDGF